MLFSYTKEQTQDDKKVEPEKKYTNADDWQEITADEKVRIEAKWEKEMR